MLKEGGKVKTKPGKAHMRKNIRDILKDEDLEAETRVAQQRELERVQRLQQQQQRQIMETATFVPSFDDELEDNPASSLVEDLQALARELEDSTLSPEMPSLFSKDDDALDSLTATRDTPLASDATMKTSTEESVREESATNVAAQVDDDVICLSSDDEEMPPRAPPPAYVLKKPVLANIDDDDDDDDDDVVILSGE